MEDDGMNAKARLSRLEAAMPEGCAHCRYWAPIVLRDDAGATSRPAACPGCGRRVPFGEVVYIVGIPLEAV